MDDQREQPRRPAWLLQSDRKPEGSPRRCQPFPAGEKHKQDLRPGCWLATRLSGSFMEAVGRSTRQRNRSAQTADRPKRRGSPADGNRPGGMSEYGVHAPSRVRIPLSAFNSRRRTCPWREGPARSRASERLCVLCVIDAGPPSGDDRCPGGPALDCDRVRRGRRQVLWRRRTG
jgi:hypothetical protein